jgi:hypothetical protein
MPQSSPTYDVRSDLAARMHLSHWPAASETMRDIDKFDLAPYSRHALFVRSRSTPSHVSSSSLLPRYFQRESLLAIIETPSLW